MSTLILIAKMGHMMTMAIGCGYAAEHYGREAYLAGILIMALSGIGLGATRFA